MLLTASIAAISFSTPSTYFPRVAQRSTIVHCAAVDADSVHYDFRYGIGNDQALASTKAIDGSVAMMAPASAPASALPAATPGPSNPKDDATRDTEGLVQPSKIREPISDFQFRHGVGSLDGEAPMAMNRAIDGSVAMMSIDSPPAPRNALPVANAPAANTPAAVTPAAVAPAVVAPAAPEKGVVQPSGKKSSPTPASDPNEFRHGIGDRALAMSPAIDGTAAMISPQ